MTVELSDEEVYLLKRVISNNLRICVLNQAAVDALDVVARKLGFTLVDLVEQIKLEDKISNAYKGMGYIS